MIVIRLKDECYRYDAYHLTKAFYPNENIESKLSTTQEDENGIPDSSLLACFREGEYCFSIEESEVGYLPQDADKQEKKEHKYRMNIALYQELSQLSGKTLDWGILIGVRPTKVAMKHWKLNTEQGQLDEQNAMECTVKWMQEHYLVSGEKAKLAMEIAIREDSLMKELDLVHGFSLYVGIPFCRTRCSYCSFTAYPLKAWEHRIDEYLDALCKEICFVGEATKANADKQLNTVYVGGGTPTSLTAKQLDRLLTCIEENFSYEHLREITVEAGRPDSITREKLEVMKAHNVERISINPQTMQEKTLKLIGREHTVQDIYDVYADARELGFANINMDLIVGLPEETLEDVESTLQAVSAMEPDSLTVHALAMKRSSKLTLSGVAVQEGMEMEKMIHTASKYAAEMGLAPYYLYRQKNIAGNYENVGYAEVDKAGIYNILIMEEKQSIVAVGAGATTKIVLPREKDNIIRVENVKDVDAYITRIDEMIERKGEWIWH